MTTPPDIGTVGMLRWIWRQLTSMRTALILLLLLGIAAVPGSLLPQRTQNPLAVRAYLAEHGGFASVLDRLRFFDVYGSPWFSSIYLLLFISLIGCVLPRTFEHARMLRKPPPATPRNLSRLEEFREVDWAGRESENALVIAETFFAREGFRTRRYGGSVAAEKGYVREAGNLLFHLSLIVILIAVALGALQGSKGEAIVNEGETFVNTATGYDNLAPGRFYDITRLTPFSIKVNKFTPTYDAVGMPLDYIADVTIRRSPTATPENTIIKVNSPLTFGSARVYLQANGFSPVVTVRDSKGTVAFQGPVALLPQDSNLTSSGAIKVPDADPSLGFIASFLPTAEFDKVRGGFSSYPDAKNPLLLLAAWEGDLGLDTGLPQSVYRLDTSKMTKIGLKGLTVGSTWALPGNDGSITFDGWVRWINIQVVRDPGKGLALGGAVAALMGLMLSLFLRRRRIWVKVLDERIEIGALSKTAAPGLRDEIDLLIKEFE